AALFRWVWTAPIADCNHGVMFNWLFPTKHWPGGRPMTPQEESQYWFFVCPTCGSSKSYADCDGIRYRTRGRLKIIRGYCERCAARKFLRLEWRAPSSSSTPPDQNGTDR
ncbi:MAG: hypothetical protein AAF386_11605, partial [Pseudomonadota bacterium]